MVERKEQSDRGSPKKQRHKCETGRWAIFERKEAILNWVEKGSSVVKGKLFFLSFPYFYWRRTLEGFAGRSLIREILVMKRDFCWSWGRGLEK